MCVGEMISDVQEEDVRVHFERPKKLGVSKRCEDTKTVSYRVVASKMLRTNSTMPTRIVSKEDDSSAFSVTLFGMLSIEEQSMIFNCVGSDSGVVALVCLCACCKWMHFMIRRYMLNTLQEETCRLACSNMCLFSVSSPTTYKDQFKMEMKALTTAKLMKRAFSTMALHCASSHCSLAIRAYNKAILKKSCDSKRCLDMGDAGRLGNEIAGVVRVVYDTSEHLSAAYDASIAYVSTRSSTSLLRVSRECTERIVRVNAAEKKSRVVLSPHSDMDVVEIVTLSCSASGPLGVCWISASHDGSALLYAVGDSRGCVKTFLWDAHSSVSYDVEFVSTGCKSRFEVDPAMMGWKSLSGSFRKACKGLVEKESVKFVVVYEQEELLEEFLEGEGENSNRYSVWQYTFDRCTNSLMCDRVGLEACEALKSIDKLSSFSYDVSGRWMACCLTRRLHQTFGCFVDVDSCDDEVIFCCPKALMGRRFVVRRVAMSPSGDKLAMLCSSKSDLCVEVHMRISNTVCVRFMHVGLNLVHPYVYAMTDNPELRILEFSPCGRFVVWRETDARSEENQGLFSVAVTEKHVDQVDRDSIMSLNIVRTNMPRDLIWRKCGIWMRLRRGAVLLQS